MKHVKTLVVLALLAAACSSPPTEAPSPTAPASETSSSQAADPTPDETEDLAQELVVGIDEDRWTEQGRPAVLGMWPDNINTFETLVRLTDDLQVEPLLASAWEFAGDNTFRFTLRDDVVFHNGDPLNADAVVWSIQLLIDIDLVLSTFVESATAVNAQTVDIITSQPNLRLPEQLAHPFFSIVADGTTPPEQNIGTGPFAFEEYVPEDHVTVTRFDDYWGEPGQLDQITFQFLPDAVTRQLALQAGDVDVITGLPPELATQVADGGFTTAAAPPGAIVVLSLNLHGEGDYTILGDPVVRRALAASMQPSDLAQGLWAGNAEVVNTVSPPSILGDAAALVEPVTGNPQEAISLLDQAGWVPGADGIREKDGRRLSLEAITNVNEVETRVVELFQGQAAEAGIEIEVVGVDGGGYTDRINAGQFDIDVNYWNQNDGNPARILTLLWYGPGGRQRIKWTGVGDDFDALVTMSLDAEDPEAARQAAAEATRLLVNDQVGAIPLTNFPRIYAYRDGVDGFSPHPSENHLRWDTVSLSS